jgi:hypothetical protein
MSFPAPYPCSLLSLLNPSLSSWIAFVPPKPPVHVSATHSYYRLHSSSTIISHRSSNVPSALASPVELVVLPPMPPSWMLCPYRILSALLTPCVLGSLASGLGGCVDVPDAGSSCVSGHGEYGRKAITAELTSLLLVRFDKCMDAFVLGLFATRLSVH